MVDFSIRLKYKGPLNADQKTKGRAFVESLGLTVNGETTEFGFAEARRIDSEYSETEVGL